MSSRIQVGQRGDIILPSEIRQEYGIEPGDTLSFIDLDGTFILTPMESQLPELAREIEKARLEAGVDTTELLQALREERARFVREMYGDE